MDYDAILDKLMDLAVKREEHFQLLEKDFAIMQDLLNRSEVRADRIENMMILLAKTINNTSDEKNRFVELHCRHKAGMISRYERRLDKAEDLNFRLVEHNRDLQRENALLIRQRDSTEDNILRNLGNSASSPHITVGDFKINQRRRNHGNGGG